MTHQQWDELTEDQRLKSVKREMPQKRWHPLCVRMSKMKSSEMSAIQAESICEFSIPR